jgi:hypothetical protein
MEEVIVLDRIIDEAYEYNKQFRCHISTAVIMRKFHLTNEVSLKIYHAVLLRGHLEARKLAKEIDNDEC